MGTFFIYMGIAFLVAVGAGIGITKLKESNARDNRESLLKKQLSNIESATGHLIVNQCNSMIVTNSIEGWYCVLFPNLSSSHHFDFNDITEIRKEVKKGKVYITREKVQILKTDKTSLMLKAAIGSAMLGTFGAAVMPLGNGSKSNVENRTKIDVTFDRYRIVIVSNFGDNNIDVDNNKELDDLYDFLNGEFRKYIEKDL